MVGSGVVAADLQKVASVTAGTATANRAVVLDSGKNVTGIEKLSGVVLASTYLDVQDRTSGITSNPDTGRAFVYVRSGVLYLKDSAGTVRSLSGGREISPVVFTNRFSVAVSHGLGVRVPLVSIIDGAGKPIEGDFTYSDSNNFIVEFNSQQSGTIYVRTVS